MNSLESMRRILSCATLVLLPLVMAVPTDVAAARTVKHARCPVVAHALIADPQAEIYEAEGVVEREMLACSYVKGHGYSLGPKPEPGTPSGGGGVDEVSLSGAVVGYQEFIVRTDGVSRWTVIVRNLRTGRVLHRLPSMGYFVQNLVVTSGGAVAWIVGVGGVPAEYAVVVADETGTHVLVSGLGIAPSSLALAGSTLYWTQDGKPSSAVLD
jgi:hypothetical protein